MGIGLNAWVKRLGQWHLSHNGQTTTLCGMPMLGNNYSHIIPESERRRCRECFAAAAKLREQREAS